MPGAAQRLGTAACRGAAASLPLGPVLLLQDGFNGAPRVHTKCVGLGQTGPWGARRNSVGKEHGRRRCVAAAVLDVGSAGARRSWRGAGCAQLAPEVVWVPSCCENLEVRGQKAPFLWCHEAWAPPKGGLWGFWGRLWSAWNPSVSGTRCWCELRGSATVGRCRGVPELPQRGPPAPILCARRLQLPRVSQGRWLCSFSTFPSCALGPALC